MSRLHCITPWQGRKPSVLSEELLFAQKREEKTYVFVRHFFDKKKWRLEFLSSPAILKRFFEVNNSEFCCEMKF